MGPMAVKVPKVRSRGGEAVMFRSSLVPSCVRKGRRVEAILPWLYVEGRCHGADARGAAEGPGCVARVLQPGAAAFRVSEPEADAVREGAGVHQPRQDVQQEG